MTSKTKIALQAAGILLLATPTVARAGECPRGSICEYGPAGQTWELGSLMPFGGEYGTCLNAIETAESDINSDEGLTVLPCTGATSGPEPQTIMISPISPGSDYVLLSMAAGGPSGLCVTIANGVEPGQVDLEPCNGNIYQEWLLLGGQVVAGNIWGGNYCLDVLGANTNSTGQAVLDLAECNGTRAQVFWPAGLTTGIHSTEIDPKNNEIECLDVLGNNEKVDAVLDDSDCNNSAAQIWVLNESHQIELAASDNLCIGLATVPESGLAQTVLSTCDKYNEYQQWYMTNDSGANASYGRVNFVNMASGGSECLDIKGNNNASPTTVDEYYCNGTQAQIWSPFFQPEGT